MGNIYIMRLKHMPEDKWNARAEGRREQRTHQPTGGRGAQGGLRIGEMERDAILGHGITDFLRESYTKRADGYQTVVCNGCGTIPIYNEQDKLYICSLCDGPVRYIGDSANNLEILPPTKRSVATFSRVEIPYATKLFNHELEAYMNMGIRYLTNKDVKTFRAPLISELTAEQETALLDAPLRDRILPETAVPEYLAPAEEPEVKAEDLAALGATEAIEEPAEPAPAEAPAEAPLPKNGLVLQLGTMNLGINPAATALEETSLDDLPYDDATLPKRQEEAPQITQQGGVNIQSSSQPFLVVPLSMQHGPAPTEIIQSPVPGAPQTIAVDTSENAMRSIGSNAGQQTPRSRSGSRSRKNSYGSSSGNGQAPTVTVNREGAAAQSSNTSSNVRVSVNKLG